MIGLTRAHTSLDGGRITGALSPYAGVVGLGIGGMLIYNGIIQNPIMYLVMLTGGWQTYERFTNPNATPKNYFNISLAQRASITGGYFGLVGALFAAMALNNEFRKPPEVLEQEKFWDESETQSEI
jgi:hypothetical protein